MSRLTLGQEIEAVVVAVTNDCVFIDLNAKSEGIIDKAEFTDKEGQCSLKEGDKVTLTIYRPATETTMAKTFDIEIRLIQDKAE